MNKREELWDDWTVLVMELQNLRACIQNPVTKDAFLADTEKREKVRTEFTRKLTRWWDAVDAAGKAGHLQR